MFVSSLTQRTVTFSSMRRSRPSTSRSSKRRVFCLLPLTARASCAAASCFSLSSMSTACACALLRVLQLGFGNLALYCRFLRSASKSRLSSSRVVQLLALPRLELVVGGLADLLGILAGLLLGKSNCVCDLGSARNSFTSA